MLTNSSGTCPTPDWIGGSCLLTTYLMSTSNCPTSTMMAVAFMNSPTYDPFAPSFCADPRLTPRFDVSINSEWDVTNFADPWTSTNAMRQVVRV